MLLLQVDFKIRSSRTTSHSTIKVKQTADTSRSLGINSSREPQTDQAQQRQRPIALNELHTGPESLDVRFAGCYNCSAQHYAPQHSATFKKHGATSLLGDPYNTSVPWTIWLLLVIAILLSLVFFVWGFEEFESRAHDNVPKAPSSGLAAAPSHVGGAIPPSLPRPLGSGVLSSWKASPAPPLGPPRTSPLADAGILSKRPLPAANKLNSPEPDLSCAGLVPAICPSLILPSVEARFMIPLSSLVDPGSQSFQLIGSSGMKLLDAAIQINENGGRSLVLRTVGVEDLCACILDSEQSSTTPQTLQIFGRGLRHYGDLEAIRGGKGAILKCGEKAVFQVEVLDPTTLMMSVSSMEGAKIGSAVSSANQQWKVQVNAGVDAVLVTSCMMAMILLWPKGSLRSTAGQ